MKKTVLLVLLLSLGAGVLFWKYWPQLVEKEQIEDQQINLTYWGLREDEGVLRPIIQAYQAAHPKVTITYVKQSFLNYRPRVQTQIRVGNTANTTGAPDIFDIHSSWVPVFLEGLSPAPDLVLPKGEFLQIYYPSAQQLLTSGGKIYALPWEIDGLALYYNEDILKAAGVGVPKNWQEFIEAARTVTVRNQAGKIQTAGAALGATANVDFWPEIVGLLFLQQPQGALQKPASSAGAEVLQFYTGFVTDPKKKTWDVDLPASTQMFIEGKLAFYFAPVGQIQVVKSTNPNLNFKTAPVPQLPGKNTSYGGFWVGAVSAASPYTKEAWEFLKYLNSPEILQQIFKSRESAQAGGYPYPRTDLAGQLGSDPYLGAFVLQAPFYQGWYLNSRTQDMGLNEEMMGVYKEAVNNVLAGKNALESLQATEASIGQILDKYGVKR